MGSIPTLLTHTEGSMYVQRCSVGYYVITQFEVAEILKGVKLKNIF